MPSYYDDGDRKISDVSYRRQGGDASNLVEEEKFKRFMYLYH